MMIKQNDPRLRHEIQAYGCNFLAHLAMVRQNWLPEEVELIYKQAIKQKIINENCKVNLPQELLAMIGATVRQIGGIDRTTGKSWGVSADSPRVKFRMARWSQKGKSLEHFTLVDAHDNEVYDPYDASIAATYSLVTEKIIGVQYYG